MRSLDECAMRHGTALAGPTRAMQYSAVGEALAALLVKRDRQLHKIAERICRIPRGDAAAADIVSDVVLRFISGDIVRDDRELSKQLAQEIAKQAYRVRRERITASRKMTPLDEDTLDADELKPGPVDADSLALAGLIQQLCRNDALAWQLHEIYSAGGLRRIDALRAGMSLSDYRSAQKRLRTYGAKARAMLDAARSQGAPHAPLQREA